MDFSKYELHIITVYVEYDNRGQELKFRYFAPFLKGTSDDAVSAYADRLGQRLEESNSKVKYHGAHSVTIEQFSSPEFSLSEGK